MTREEIERIWSAAFQDGRASAASVQDDDAAAHSVLGFDHWWQEHGNGLLVSAERQPRLDLWNPVTLGVLCNATNPPKPVCVDILDSKRQHVASVTLENFKECAGHLARLEEARK